MSFAVRVACAADVPAMHRVRNSVRENRLSDPHGITERSYLPYVSAGSAWIAEADAAMLGFAALDAQTGRVWALFVDPDVEGAGVGRALHRRMLEWARQQGILDLSLSTEKGTRAVEFYKSAGWIESGVTAEGELLFGLTLDA
jgi:GNAT superfamily N-acetyltransferase